jgi:small subunit ribosomal protein S13
MPRVLGIDIPGRKKLEYSLRYIYGIGPSTAKLVCEKAQLDPNKKADAMTDEDIQRLIAVLQNDYRIEGDLRRLISIGSYRGRRHRAGLPVRGQRTKTNARTRKGAKRTVGIIRGKEARSAAKAGK